MSNEKINLQQFKSQLVTKSGLTGAQVNEFVEAFQEIFRVALEQDKLLKISGLGTFKLVWVEERKSVNVQTKSEFVIPGHYKVAFTPDSKMLEVVNAPYAHLEPIELTNEGEVDDYELPLQKLNEQAVELKGILADIQDLESVPASQPVKAAAKDIPVVEPVVEAFVSPVVDEPASVEAPASSAAPIEPELVPERGGDTIEIVIPGVDSATVIDVKPRRSYRGVLVFALIVAVLVAIVIVGYLYKDTLFAYYNRFVEKVEEVNTNTSDVVNDEIPLIVVDSVSVVDELKDTVSVVSQESTIHRFDAPRTYSEFIGNEKILDGSRLTLISNKYYGEKSFWVYIYEANKDVIDNPDRLKIGVVVRIPKLPAYLINKTDSACMAYAKQLHDIYVSK